MSIPHAHPRDSINLNCIFFHHITGTTQKPKNKLRSLYTRSETQYYCTRIQIEIAWTSGCLCYRLLFLFFLLMKISGKLGNDAINIEKNAPENFFESFECFFTLNDANDLQLRLKFHFIDYKRLTRTRRRRGRNFIGFDNI